MEVKLRLTLRNMLSLESMCVPDTYFVLSTSSHRKKRAYLILLNGIKSCKEVNVAPWPNYNKSYSLKGGTHFQGLQLPAHKGNLEINQLILNLQESRKNGYLLILHEFHSFSQSHFGKLTWYKNAQKCAAIKCVVPYSV